MRFILSHGSGMLIHAGFSSGYLGTSFVERIHWEIV